MLAQVGCPQDGTLSDSRTYRLIANPLVSVHFQATIAGHWFYTLVKGRPAGKANDNGCFVAVEPLDSDAQKAIDAAALLVFRSFPALQPADGFQKAREMTTMMASTTLNAAARKTVEAAWHAVGVGGAPKPNSISPKEGATDVNPWDVNFRWEVGQQSGPWTLRWATDNEFKDAKIVNVTGVRADNGVRSATADIALPPGKTIYWQAVEGSGNVNWECGAFWSHFSTAPQDIKVVEPATIGQDGFYQTNPLGAVLWGRTPGADKYEARLSLTSDDCAESAAWTQVPQDFLSRFAEVYLGDTIAENLVLIRDPVKLFPQGEIDLDQNTTYHLYIRAVHGDQRGACGHFPVRKAMLKPFDMIGSLDVFTLPFKSGGPFAWQPSQGAVR